jgi:hypothetical protein
LPPASRVWTLDVGASAAIASRRDGSQAGFGVRDEEGEFGEGVAGVEGKVDRAGGEAAEIERQRFRTFVDLNRHPVARRDPAGHELCGKALGQSKKFAIGDATTSLSLHEQARAVGVAAGEREEVGAHAAGQP